MWKSVGTIAPGDPPGTFFAPRVGALPDLDDPRLFVLATPITGALVVGMITHTVKGALIGGAVGSGVALLAILFGNRS